MEELYEYDANQLNPRAQELMRAAADEIIRLAASTNAAYSGVQAGATAIAIRTARGSGWVGLTRRITVAYD
jgi:hypothetical protein